MSGFLLHLMRHGAPETPGLLMGRTDGAPTAEGIAACVGQTGDLPFDTIVASDLCRAGSAAQAIGAARDLPVRIDPRWRELDSGAWDGLPPAQVDPAAMSRFWDDPDRFPPPGGERWSSLVARVSAALNALPAADTLVVTHGGAIRAALAGLLGFGQRQVWAFDLPYNVVLSLRLWPGNPPSAQIIGLWQ
jgi:alpha-ribazole phosphatase